MDYDKLLAARAKAIQPSGIRKFFDIAAEMGDVISLSVGEPDFKTPWQVREAGARTLEQGRTWYTANAGLLPLKTEICRYLQRRFDLDYNPDGETLVTVGGSEGIDLCIRALVNPGDEVVVPEPCYVSYAPIAQLTGATVVPVATRVENGFRLTADELRAALTERTKLLILPYPNNPTGAVMRREHLEGLAEVLRGTDVMVLSDEIYGELTYGVQRHVSFPEIEGMRERTILIGGFSKAYAMTGWRLGYACGPTQVLSEMTKIHQFAIMCAPTTSQYAAVTALRECDEQVEEMRGQYDMRRRLLVSELNKMGLACFEPEGAFYVFPDIRSTGLSSEEFCERLLRSKRVAVIPGTAFGTSGEGFVRISYSYSVQHLIEALRRIGEFLAELRAAQ